MKKIIFNLFLLFGVFSFVQAQTLEQKIYIDFGPNESGRGTVTDSPDKNGNHWNNVVDVNISAEPVILVNSASATTGYSLDITGKFTSNGMSGGGGLLEPDEELLGDLAIATATEDYFFVEGTAGISSSFKIRNLKPTSGYKFYIFGSRSGTSDRIAVYTLIGNNRVVGRQLTTGNGVGGSLNQNNSEIFESDYVFPDANGNITFELFREQGDYAHINVMKIEEYTGLEVPSYSISQNIYIDFGKDGTGDVGSPTESPDVNGNYWNNAIQTGAGSTLSLINSSDESTGWIMEVTKNFNSNGGDDFGGLLTPDADLLYDFAIPTATEDYFFVEGTGHTSELKIKNLNQGNGYRFYIFGSRIDGSARVAEYIFTGLNRFTGLHQTSDSNMGGKGTQNDRNIFQSDILFPDDNGEITLEISRYAGSYAHINIMKIEEIIDLGKENATSITIYGEDITVSGATTQFTYEVEPVNAVYPDIVWSVSDETIAWIDANGKLYPKSNGTVTVTATINYGTESVSGSKEISITNQLASIYFAGSASERGEGLENAIPMNMITDLNGTVTGKFEVYTYLKDEGDFHFYTSLNGEEAIVYGQADSEGSIVSDGTGIRASSAGPARITVYLVAHTYSILPINNISLVGSLVEEADQSWSLSSGKTIDYKGDGVWEEILEYDVPTYPGDPARFVFCINNTWDYLLKKYKGSDIICLESTAKEYGYEDDIHDITLRNGTFRIMLDLRNNVYEIECLDKCEHTIAIMGSSVANGQGATDNKGYAYMYGQLLEERAESGDGYPWAISHISVNGNNTTQLLNRFEKDLVDKMATYVMYGVSLGNEGVHENGQTSFDSYLANMGLLIDQAYDNGITPVACNNYTRVDFILTDYQFVKDMNILMHEWDIPTINLLGAIDNGAGKWATGYGIDDDIYHPNHQGHVEFFYAIVPSLFDAIHDGKPQPQRVNDVSYTLKNERIELVPEHTIHPYTLSFDIKTSSTGVIATGVSTVGTGTLEIVSNGDIKYTSPTGETIQYAASLTDNEWHKISLTHYYAWGKTFLYVDKKQAGEINEKLAFEKFYLGDEKAPGQIEYSQLHFYRSAMSEEEIAALVDGRMLKSSLEIYAPLDGESDEPLVNLAQSNNTLSVENLGGNSITDIVADEFPKVADVYSVDGKKVATFEMESANAVP